MKTFSFKKIYLDIPSAFCKPFCPNLHVISTKQSAYHPASIKYKMLVLPTIQMVRRFFVDINRQLLRLDSYPHGQNGRLFANGIFRCISLNGKLCILIIKICLSALNWNKVMVEKVPGVVSISFRTYNRTLFDSIFIIMTACTFSMDHMHSILSPCQSCRK